MTQNPNQFSQTVTKGMLDLKSGSTPLPVQVDSAQATDLVAGQVVKIATTAGGVPKVLGVANDTDAMFGVVIYAFRKNNYPALANLEIAQGGAVVYMEASAAIARGARVMAVVTGSKIATATTGKRIVGMALDTALVDGDLIRVLIADVVTAPSVP